MPLSTLNWRYVGNANYVSGIAAAHDALYTLGIATTYADGSARTPGSGSAWTWNREQSAGTTVAVYGTPPINATSMAYIIGGIVGTPSYTFLSPDTAVATNGIVVGMARGAGAYTSWTNAQPFTSGFSGYWRATRQFSTVAYDNVALWESQEGCIVQWSRASTGECSYAAFGALFDPLSSAAADAETDGRRYFFGGSGSTSTMFTFWSFWTGASADGSFLGHSTANGASHFGTFNIGTTTVTPLLHTDAFAPNTALLTPAGNIVQIPFSVVSTAGTWYGQSRQLYVIRDAVSRQAWVDGATTIGYIVASSSTSSADACLLKY